MEPAPEPEEEAGPSSWPELPPSALAAQRACASSWRRPQQAESQPVQPAERVPIWRTPWPAAQVNPSLAQQAASEIESEPEAQDPEDELQLQRATTESEAAGGQEEPEGEHAAEAADPDLHAIALLAALAECPFGASEAAWAEFCMPAQQPRQIGPPRDAWSTARVPAVASAPALSPKAVRQLEDAAAVAIRGAAALAQRGCGTRHLSAALAHRQGLGGSVRSLRRRAAAGDARASALVSELDTLRRSIGIGGVDGAAQARRLQFALSLPEGSAARKEALEEAATLCRKASALDILGEPEQEDGCEAHQLLTCAQSQLSLQEALDTGDVEL